MTKAKTIKLTALLLLVVCAALFASGCGAEKSALGAVKEAMLAADDTMPEMKEASSESEDAEKLFGSLSDVSYDKVKDYFLCYAAVQDGGYPCSQVERSRRLIIKTGDPPRERPRVKAEYHAADQRGDHGNEQRLFCKAERPHQADLVGQDVAEKAAYQRQKDGLDTADNDQQLSAANLFYGFV